MRKGFRAVGRILAFDTFSVLGFRVEGLLGLRIVVM